MAAMCPRCRRDIDPFVAHFCGDRHVWREPMSTPSGRQTSATSARSWYSCCGSSSQGSCPCGRNRARITATSVGQVPGSASIAATPTPVSDSLGEASWRTLTIHPDERGNVRETYRTSWWPEIPPIKQLVRSESVPTTLRGMHLHRRQWDLWHFVSGDAVVRLRYADGGEDFARYDAGSTLAIPPGVAHGFYTEKGCILLYALTEEYDGTDEFGFYPFDGLGEGTHPAWPTNHLGIVVSERDLRAPRLSEFEW